MTLRRTKTGIGLPKPQQPNDVWHLDFGQILVGGRKVWILCVIDLFSRMCLTAEVQPSFGSDIIQVLNRIASQRGAPRYLGVDRSCIFAEADIMGWAADHGTHVVYPNSAYSFGKGIVERLFRSLDFNGAHNVALTVNAWNRALKDRK